MSRAVIDQPGLRVLFIGLLLAIVFGFGLRSQISSTRVEKSLQRSILILEKDFLIDFEAAEVRLTKWGLPLPHLIISKLRISPKKNLCHNSQIFIDEFELPLQIKQFFSEEKTIDVIRAKNVEVRLVDIEDCFTKEKKRKSENAGPEPSGAVDSELAVQSRLFSQKTGTRLKEIVIDQLKIVSSRSYDQPMVFKQLKFFLNYEEAKLSQIDIKSRLYSIKDSRSDIYFLISDLNASIKPDSQKNIEVTLQLKGRLLDGDVQVFLQGSTKNQKATYEVTTHNVSMKAYAPLLSKILKDQALDKWPLSTSFYMVGEVQQTKELKAFFKFKNFEAIGENMRVDFPEMNLEIIDHQPFLWPFQVSLNHVPLAPLKMILADRYDFQSVENLGVIDGLLKYEDHQHWNFDGNIEKMELIFSNRGSREIEIIDSIGINLVAQSDRLMFSADQITIHQNEIQGGLKGEFHKNAHLLQLKLDLEGKVLNERVWKQLTQVSQNPSVKLSWSYKKANEERHQIKMNSSELEFQGFRLSDVQIDYLQLIAEETRSLALSLKTGRAEIHVPLLNPNISRAFFNEETELNSSDVFTALRTQVGLQGSDWKNMNFDIDLNLFDANGTRSLDHFNAKGEWKSDSSLSGVASLQNSKRILKYNISKRNKEEIDFIPEKTVE